MTKKLWDPKEEPYRVTWTYRTSSMGGWTNRHRTYADYKEAWAELDKPLPRNVISVYLHLALVEPVDNEDDQEWRWVLLGSRENRGVKRHDHPIQ